MKCELRGPKYYRWRAITPLFDLRQATDHSYLATTDHSACIGNAFWVMVAASAGGMLWLACPNGTWTLGTD